VLQCTIVLHLQQKVLRTATQKQRVNSATNEQTTMSSKINRLQM